MEHHCLRCGLCWEDCVYLKLYGSDSKVCGMFTKYWAFGQFFDRFVACIGWFWNLKEVQECLLDFALFRGCSDKQWKFGSVDFVMQRTFKKYTAGLRSGQQNQRSVVFYVIYMVFVVFEACAIQGFGGISGIQYIQERFGNCLWGIYDRLLYAEVYWLLGVCLGIFFVLREGHLGRVWCILGYLEKGLGADRIMLVGHVCVYRAGLVNNVQKLLVACR